MTDRKNKDYLPRHLRNAPGKFDYLKQLHDLEPKPDPDGCKHLGITTD